MKRKESAMTEESKLTLEMLNREVEKIGSLLSSVSVQVSGIRSRVADLELWGAPSGAATAAGKDENGERPPSKRPDGRPGKGNDGQGKGKQGQGKGKQGQGKGKQGQGKGKQGKGGKQRRGGKQDKSRRSKGRGAGR